MLPLLSSLSADQVNTAISVGCFVLTVALYFASSNFVRVHHTTKTTPAVSAGLTDHVWTLEELLTCV